MWVTLLFVLLSPLAGPARPGPQVNGYRTLTGRPRAAHVRPLQLCYFAFTYAPNAFGTGYTSAKSSAAAQT